MGYVNFEVGMANCGDESSIYKEILDMFIDGNALESIKKLYEGKDWNKFAVEVHALKSTSLTVGGEALSLLAKKLEFASKAIIAGDALEQNTAYIDGHMIELEESYNATIEEMKIVSYKIDKGILG